MIRLCALFAALLAIGCGSATSVPERREPGPGHVSIRDDGVFLVDGAPFFPLGLYYAGEELNEPSGAALAELRRAGFNTIGFHRFGHPNWQATLARVEQAGLKVWQRGSAGIAPKSAAEEATLTAEVQALRGQRALLFWEFVDEPSLYRVPREQLLRGQAIVREHDPHHPLLMVDWPTAVSRFADYRGVGDVHATDLYPIPRAMAYGALANHDITQIRDYLSALRTAHPTGPLMLVLQAWAWNPLTDGENGYPTVAQSRFMAYQAVVHGARGLLYFGQRLATKPNFAASLPPMKPLAKSPEELQERFVRAKAENDRFWQGHAALFAELARMSRIFVLPEAPPANRARVAGSCATVELTTRALKSGGRVVIAVNASASSCRAELLVPGARAVRRLLDPATPVPLAAGRIVDELAPYGVQLYRVD